jgi:hypothetical protein
VIEKKVATSAVARYRQSAKGKAVAAANTKAYRERLKKRGIDPNAREKKRYHAARKRGVVSERLAEPRHVSRLAAVLRWSHPRSSNGSWMGESVWEYCEVFGVATSITRQASWADRGSVSLIADRWLKDHDSLLSAAAAATSDKDYVSTTDNVEHGVTRGTTLLNCDARLDNVERRDMIVPRETTLENFDGEESRSDFRVPRRLVVGEGEGYGG